MKHFASLLVALSLTGSVYAQSAVETRQLYLSGHGCDDMVTWDFYCTEGQNSGRWTKIGVPSCWETQGFGTFQYGVKFYKKPFAKGVAGESGLYKYEFTVPADWKGCQVDLVFEASMTDTKVRLNGHEAGPTHQGAFYRFSYDVSDLLSFGRRKNLLEVDVCKESTNGSVNLAERRADYWNFGGIFRPVFLVAKPLRQIASVAVDAQADGHFVAECTLRGLTETGRVKTQILDAKGREVASHVTSIAAADSVARVDFNVKDPALWSAETPHLYTAQFTLQDAQGQALHQERTRFGFRTVETRLCDGLYINGHKITVRGVNRHSFRPESGRTLSRAKNIEDVLLIKSMNMNSVRLSHYPADPDFYDACDSLGLYVMDELTSWQGHYDTEVGRKLVHEMMPRDVNHPSVIWWSNGNEGGWNTDLDADFEAGDIQHRPIIHPWDPFSGYHTKHYRSYGETQAFMREPYIFMPTEFLHGLYDGGHGAGLYDYWEMMRANPRCAGGFLWVLADEGVIRRDKNDSIDCDGNHGPDGIVGPHHEKEGSYYTIKQLWCPVQITSVPDTLFDGVLQVENRYDFLNLNTCRFSYRYVSLPAMGSSAGETVLRSGHVAGPDVAARCNGTLQLPKAVRGANVLQLTVTDLYGQDLFTWSFAMQPVAIESASVGSAPQVSQTDSVLTAETAGRTYTFSQKTGYLQGVKVNDRNINLHDGPRFVAARRSDRSLDQYFNLDDKHASSKKTQYSLFRDPGRFVGFDVRSSASDVAVTARYTLGCLDSVCWRISADGEAHVSVSYNFGGVVDLMGVMFDYPEAEVQHKRWVGDGPYRVWQNRMHGPQLGLWEHDYNDPIPGESFIYPEFKGYFAHVQWMSLTTTEGTIHIGNGDPSEYVGVYQPRDGRDELLYRLPATGLSVMHVIPPVRNKVNTTDLIGPSSQPFWAQGSYTCHFVLRFD